MGCGNSKKAVDDKPVTQTITEKTVRKPAPVDTLPRTQPPTSRKREIFNRDDLRDAENRAHNVPAHATSSFHDLIKDLTEGATDDIEKAWSVYVWLITLNFSNTDRTDTSEAHCSKDSPDDYVKKIRDGESDLPTFFSLLCRRIGVPCVVVDGISKNGSYEVGMSERQVSLIRARWNAVFLADSWRLVNAIAGSSVDESMKDYWFMTDPEEFSTMCHPDNVKWQLLVQPYSRKQFSNLPFCKPEFFRFNIKIIEPTYGRVKSLHGRVSVELAAPKAVASKLLISHKLQGRMLLKPKNISLREVIPKLELSQDMDTDEQEGPENVEKITSETEESIHFPDNLDRYVFMTRRETHTFFEVMLPVAGSYLFNVHCALTSKNEASSNLPVACQFKIVCNDPSDIVEPLPDTPLIGWGPTFDCSRHGLRPLSHKNGPIFMTPNEPVDIQFKINKELDFKTVLLHHVIPAEELKNHISHHVNDKILTVHASIPQDGRYALEIFAKPPDELEFRNVCNYLLIYDKSNPNLEKYPKRMLRERLERAISKGTRSTLEIALDNFIMHLVPDHGEISKANDKLQYFGYKQALADAIKRRNISVLEQCVQKARTSKYSVELEDDINKAEDFLNKLRRLHGFLHPIKKLEMRTILEIRSYTRPKPVIQDILTATYVLLGEDEEIIQDWGYVQSLLAQSGKGGLQKRIERLDIDRVPRDSIEMADGLLENHNLNEAREASAGAAAFFQWAKHICTERKEQAPKEEDTNKNKANKNKKGKQAYKEWNSPRKTKAVEKT